MYAYNDDTFHQEENLETQPILGRDDANQDNYNERAVLPPYEQVQKILGTRNQNLFNDLHSETPCLFTELQQLKINNDEYTWKEVARWIKFEETVEEGGQRWSKPHVSSLNLHDLFELRSCLLNGVVLLNTEVEKLDEVADLVLENLIALGHVTRGSATEQKLKQILLCSHEHQSERRKRTTSIKGSQLRKSVRSRPSQSCETEVFSDESKMYKVPYFMKKIPVGAEAANILVGEVPFMQQRIAALVRFNECLFLEKFTEVPVPTRFIFILLGPVGSYKQYYEIGRSLATLMTDEIFRVVAYKAQTKNDVISGVDEFLDQVTVLPPGGWNSKIRIDPPKELPTNQTKRLMSTRSGKCEHDGESNIQPHDVPPELKRTGRLFGGLMNDIKRKAPFYSSDFKDCFSIQCLASFIFLYFAILTPIVTFGGLLSDATDSYLGTMESIFGGAISGITYHLFSGQPLTIIGSTGPILVFEKIMFEICTTIGYEYISFRFWVGLWTGFICILLVAFDVSSLITYVTRYTEESFSALISFIFIYEAFKKLAHDGNKHPIWKGWNPNNITLYECDCVPPLLENISIAANFSVESIIEMSKEEYAKSHSDTPKGQLYKLDNTSYMCAYAGHINNVTDMNNISWSNLTKNKCLQTNCGVLKGDSCPYAPDAILMSVVLFFGTFAVATALKKLKTSRYFPTMVRSIISDFAVTIAIALMVLFDLLIDVNTSKLKVPQSFRPTREDRKWTIDPFGNNSKWSAILALLPALLATILIFMDQQITAVIVNRKENKLKKSCGYHLDLLIVAVMLIICSVFGLPWFVAATVLSITHVNSLRMESETSAPGDVPKFYGIREQRVTGIMIFLMIGLSVFLTPVLAHIPMPVLYGVFLYMGVSSLKGVQFFDRIMLFFIPAKHQPDYVYLRHVPLNKVYLFTAIQVSGLAILWVIKSSPPVSIIFPMMVAALVGIRKLLDFGIFTQHDLKWLDDLIPESTKKKREDALKKEKQKAIEMKEFDGVEVPLDGGKVIRIPVTELRYDSVDGVNISEEMSKTAIWQTLSSKELESVKKPENKSANLKNSSEFQASDGAQYSDKTQLCNGNNDEESSSIN